MLPMSCGASGKTGSTCSCLLLALIGLECPEMQTTTDYIMAWSIYLLSAVAVMVVFWRLTAGAWDWLRDALRVILAVVMITPASVDGTQEHLAPAVFVVVYELLTSADGGLGPLVGVRMLLVAGFSVIAAWLLRFLWNRLVVSRREPPPAVGPSSRHS